jgi:carboxyl-terminal processing protease
MTHTKGEFGGLGITIGLTENVLTIIAPLPIPNSPAMKVGLLAGDRIIKIEGKSTEGIALDEAVSKLRGPKGTVITITIDRDGEKAPFDVEIERDIIKINSVPFHAIIDEKNKVGYLKLVSFTQVSSKEVEDAVRDLNAKGMKSLILDLRMNPGGLLKEAVGVAEEFLPKGDLIVYTQGRNPSQKSVFEASGDPVLANQVPLIVLVDMGSASASEIVAGAIQDHDRGVIMGNETFGKGSVQTILPLEQKKALKLTTAYYYTPTGRCINKLSNDVGSKRHEAEREDEEAVKKKDTTAAKPKKEEFKTLKLGRTVYGGGGITPDIDVVPERYSALERAISLKSLFFKFATAEIAQMKAKNIKMNEDSFRVSEELYNNFIAFIKKKEFIYKSPDLDQYAELKKIVERGRKDLGDTSKTVNGPYDKDVDKAASALEAVLTKDRDHAFVRFKDDIKDRLTQAFLGTSPNQDPYYRYALKKDRYVNEAIKVAIDRKKYDNVLRKDFKRSGL